MPAFRNVLELIGNTPMVELTRLDTGPCRLFVKLESQNPGGSIKDRIALSMIEAAERDGQLDAGRHHRRGDRRQHRPRPGAGRPRKGLPTPARRPRQDEREKILHLRALGAEVRMTRSDVGKGHPEYYQDMAERIAAETPGAFYVNQFANPANPLRARERHRPGDLGADGRTTSTRSSCGVGSGGTLTGLGRFFAQDRAERRDGARRSRSARCWRRYVTTGKHGEAGSWLVEGIGEDFVPPNADLSLVVARPTSIPDEESIADGARAAAQGRHPRPARRPARCSPRRCATAASRRTPKRVVTFVCDSGNKYLSKMFNDFWLVEQGLARARAARRSARPHRAAPRRAARR